MGGGEGLCTAPKYPWQPPWLLRGSHRIKQQVGHESGQVNDASLYQLSSLLALLPSLHTSAPWDHTSKNTTRIQTCILAFTFLGILPDGILQTSQVESFTVPRSCHTTEWFHTLHAPFPCSEMLPYPAIRHGELSLILQMFPGRASCFSLRGSITSRTQPLLLYLL